MSVTHVITSVYHTRNVKVLRTARERWWSWPWRPWIKIRSYDEPRTDILRLPDGTLVMHPTTHAAWLASSAKAALEGP